MKNIIERIAGGAKIARYLPKAVSTRLAVAALAALAAGGALATDSLEETGGALSAVGTDTLAFKGVTLSELTAETLHGRMSGDWAGTAATESFTFNNFDRSNEGSGYITCQAQLYNDGWLKGMVLKFTQSGDDINAQIVSAGSINGGSVGGSVAGADNANSHYAIYNLSLTRSWSDSAVVIWEAGQFGVTSKTGSDGNTYTLDLNENALSEDAKTITIDQSVGVKVDFPSAKTSGVTVLFRYSDLTPSGEKALVFSTNSQDANRTGVYLNSTTAGQPTGIWNTTDDYTTTQNRNNMTSALSAGVFAFQYREGTGATSSNANGTSLYVLTNGVRYAIYTATGLKTDSNSYGVSGCTLGGMRTKTGATLKNAATGMKITGIAVFDGILSEAQMTSFVWPSAAAAEYAKWSYASYVLTCNSGFSNFESPNYSTFDLKSGYDIMPTYTTSVAPVKWQCFGYSKASGFDSNAYAAPGNVLRFVNASHACVAKFSPLTIGGMIVESTATGCSLEASDGTRSTILGDPTANAETWFKFDTSFSMARTGAYAIMGTVNLEINNSASVTFAGVAQISGAGAKAAGTNPSHTAGGVLKIHGNGSMTIDSIDASDATLDYTDLSATSSTAADAYIQGTLTVNDSTVIALPAGATFPYFVASAASGTLDPANGVTIGGVAAPGYKLKSDGSVVAPRTVTISGNETWGTGTLNGWPTDDSTEGYAITVTADATLTLPSAVSCDVLSITVEDGVTLTISGNTITAADCFYLTGTGTVKVGAGNTFIGTVKGDGNLAYPDNTIPTASTAVFTRLDWSGTLILSSIQGSSSGQPGWYAPFHNYGNTNSTIKVAGFTGFFAAGNQETAATLEIAAGTTFTLNNGNNGNSMTFGKLTGSGDIVICGANSPAIQYVMRDASEFAGSITVSQSESSDFKKSIVLGGGSSYNYNTSNYQKQICVLGDVTIAAGKTWTADSGIVNNGTITLNGALSGMITGSGTVECSQGVDLTGSGFSDSANWTGTVRLNGDATPVPSTSYDETSYGNASSTLEIASGSVAITEATTLPGTVNVASGASLFVTSSATELTLAGSNSGTINLSVASALKTLNLNLTGNGSIVYPSSLTTLNVTYTESLADDGVKAFTVNGATFAGGTMTLTRPDGTTESVTGTADGNTLSFEWTPAVSGAACWCAYEMEYESGVKTGFENSGSDNTALSSDGVTGSDAFTDDGMLYTYAHPWRNMRDDNAYPSSWTAVVRCTVPAYENAAVITFGTQSGGLIGLVAGTDPETQMKLVKTTGNSAFTTLATMTVQNATTAQHVYVFSVENNQIIKVYCDGEQVLNETYSTFTLGGGIQVGSVHGGIGSTGIVRFGKGESPANTLSETVQKAARIDCVRLYKTALGPNAIAQLSVEFPAVKLYRATVAANATTTWDALTWSPAWDDGNEYSKIILTAEGNASLTLPDSITADEFTINVASGSTLTLAKATGGTAMTVSKLEIDDGTVAVADANFFGSRVINGTGTLKITATGALTSALSGNAKFEIPSGVGVGVMSGGSIANAITGAGELAYQNPADVPATSLTFSAWTGAVSLPIVNASNGVNFNNYGTTGSTVALAGMTGGYILEAGKTVNPTLRLDGAMNITAMSSWTYTFAEITGSGNLSFSTSANSPTVNITKVAEGYSGTISSTLANPVTIATLDRAAGTTVTPGSKVLSTSSGVQASALTVGGEATGIVPVFDTDGLYVKAASVTKNDTTTYHDTVAAALTAAGSDAATITLLAPTDNAITLAPGQTLVNGNLTTGSVAGPNGYEVVNNNGTYTLVDNTASTWAPAENSDNNWGNRANWSTGYLPSQYTVVTFPASESAHVVNLTLNNANSEAERHRCASMVLNGNVTFQRANSGTWAYVFVYGNVTGTGTLTFEQTGLNTPANSSIAVSCPVVGNAAANDNFFSGTNATYTFSAAVDVAAGEFKADRANLVFSGPVTIRNGGYVKSNGEGASATFNGGINVPAGASASLTVNGGSQHTIASTVTLGAGATFTIPTATTVSGATFTAASGYDVVHSTSGDNTVYTTELKGATVSNVAVSYGADYTSATVTATVSDATLDYYISWASGEPVKGTISGSTVTFDVSGIVHSEPYQSSGYNISAKDGETTVTTTGGSGESVAADVAANWINENATTHGLAAAGGAWTNAEAVSYSEGKAAISDNRFAATTASTASRVVLEFEVCFSSTSADDVSGEAQAAIKLGEDDGVTTFKVLTTGNAWTSVSNAELPIDPSATYDVVLTIDYGTSTYKVDVEGKSLTNSAGVASFSLATNKAAVQNIDFVGSGTLTSMKGDQLEGYMVKDALNHFYATIEAATQAYNSANGPYIVLHDGTAPSGWKIDNATKKLIKIAKGLFFMAY